MTELERPPPPIVGKVTHHNIELYWDEALAKANKAKRKGDGRIRVCVQEEDRQGTWGNVYTGYGKRHVIDSLEPWSQYRYRLRFMNERGASEFSPSITVSTTKEPLTGEHLHRAIMLQDIGKLESVLEAGSANVDAQDKYGFSPLMSSAQKGFIEMLELLVKYGADVNFQNDSGKTSLMLSAYAGKLQSVKELRYHGARYDIFDKGGSTALHWAVDGGNTELIEWMIDDGADVHAKDHNGWTPFLRTAAVNSKPEVAKLFLMNGASIDGRDKDGKTTLMIAVVNGNRPLVEMLLENGADIGVKNEFGKSTYEMSLAMERRQVSKALEEHMDRHGIKYH